MSTTNPVQPQHLGTITARDFVHRADADLVILCRQLTPTTPRITTVIATVENGGDEQAVMAALLEGDAHAGLLCERCFTPGFREAYLTVWARVEDDHPEAPHGTPNAMVVRAQGAPGGTDPQPRYSYQYALSSRRAREPQHVSQWLTASEMATALRHLADRLETSGEPLTLEMTCDQDDPASGQDGEGR
jgi:hypothetical protein